MKRHGSLVMGVTMLYVTGATAAPMTNMPRAELLARLRQEVAATVKRLPRYICTETISRSVLLPPAGVSPRPCEQGTESIRKHERKRRLSQSDRLRLDVAVTEEGEMYSWVGENGFGNQSLVDLVGGGVVSTGAFGGFLTAIFGGDAASYVDQGNITWDGRSLAEFSYRVPPRASGYTVANGHYEAIVPYSGTFLVDPETASLVRLTVTADSLPPQLHTCQDTTTLDYTRIELNGSQFILPSNARLRVVDDNGGESNNATTFAACHQFTTESKLTFDMPEADSSQRAGAAPSAALLAIPEGLNFRLALARPIQTRTAAAGDSITARLTTPLKDHHGVVLIPKGATIAGRIVRFKHFYAPDTHSLVVAIKLETVEKGGIVQPLHARFATLILGSPTQPVRPDTLTGLHLGSFDKTYGHQDPSFSFVHIENATDNYVIGAGLMMNGVTLATPQTGGKIN